MHTMVRERKKWETKKFMSEFMKKIMCVHMYVYAVKFL